MSVYLIPAFNTVAAPLGRGFVAFPEAASVKYYLEHCTSTGGSFFTVNLGYNSYTIKECTQRDEAKICAETQLFTTNSKRLFANNFH